MATNLLTNDNYIILRTPIANEKLPGENLGERGYTERARYTYVRQTAENNQFSSNAES